MSQFLKIEAIQERFDHMLDQKPYQMTSNGIEISVWIEFLNNKLSNLDDIFIWVYQVRIENRNKFPIKLVSRHLKIIDQNGQVREINEHGAMGEEIRIDPLKSYQYCSGVHLKNPSGILTGNYLMSNLDNNQNFEVKIPGFSLDIPENISVIN